MTPEKRDYYNFMLNNWRPVFKGKLPEYAECWKERTVLLWESARACDTWESEGNSLPPRFLKARAVRALREECGRIRRAVEVLESAWEPDANDVFIQRSLEVLKESFATVKGSPEVSSDPPMGRGDRRRGRMVKTRRTE